jgi:hypothetical protein
MTISLSTVLPNWHTGQEKTHGNSSLVWKKFSMLSKNYASHGVKPYRPVQQPGGGCLEDTLTTSIKDAVNSYNKFLLIHVLQASALENV